MAAAGPQTCPSCQTRLPDGAAFCFMCGAATPQEIDRNTGNVLWSTMEVPKSASAKDLDHAAQNIVERLAKAKK